MQHNPFSTRKTNPGKIPFFFQDGDGGSPWWDIYVDPFYDVFYPNFIIHNFQSQIVGGHGTGKTTFLIEFVRFLEIHGHIANHITLHDKQRFLTREFWERQKNLVFQFKCEVWKEPPIAVVDGYEQLSLAQKIRLRQVCRKGRCGLVITSHTPAWRLPLLLRTEPTYQTLQNIIGHLFRDQSDMGPPDETLCRSLFDRHHGNIRNVLFDLYDHYEQGEGVRGEG